MLKAYKYRLLPNKQQSEYIDRCIGCARFAYNSLLCDYKEQLNNGTEKPKLKEVTFLKKDNTFLNEVDSLALANAKQNLQGAIKAFFDYKKGKRNGKRIGFPKMHKKGFTRLSYTTNNQGGNVRIKNNAIKLPKVGFVKLVYHRELIGNIRSVTVSQEKDGKYYVSILSDYDYKPLKRSYDLNSLKVVGIDMSFTDFCIDSDCILDVTKPKYIKRYKESEKKRSKLNRQLSRKMKGSNSRDKARKKLASLDRKIANRHKDFCHKMSKYYATHFDVIVLEDLNMQQMSRGLRGSGKSVSDLSFGLFKQYLSYKCELYDSCVMYADKWFASSKICNHCGSKNTLLQLSDREWVCPSCGCVIERDLNAAYNLRDYFYKVIDTAGTAEIHAVGDKASTLRETLMQVLSLKAEAPNFRWG